MAKTLKAGDTADKDVFLVYGNGGYTSSDLKVTDTLKPGDRGSALVLKGDTVTEAMVTEHDRVTALGSKPTPRKAAAPAATTTPPVTRAPSVGVPTATGDDDDDTTSPAGA